jgi:hypothetical protein
MQQKGDQADTAKHLLPIGRVAAADKAKSAAKCRLSIDGT